MYNLKRHLIFSFFMFMMIPFISFSQTNLSVNINAINPKCNGNADGSATVTATGGTAPYTYNWSPSGGTQATPSNLASGTYKVLVTDNTGISILDSITILQPPALTASIDSIIVQPCFLLGGGACGCGNTLWAVVNGGTGSYTYNWSPGGQTTDSIFNVCYVDFTVVVTDSNNCAVSRSLNVVIPPQPNAAGITQVSNTKSLISVYPNPASTQISISLSDATNNAHIEIYDMLGNKVIEQKINASILTNVDVANLVAGNYFLRVTDGSTQKTARFSINR